MQVILLSATMPSDVLEVTHRFMREPVRILVKKEELTLEGIRQFYVQVEREVCFHPLNLFNSDAIIQMWAYEISKMKMQIYISESWRTNGCFYLVGTFGLVLTF